MTIGAHVRAGGDLLGALVRGRDIEADCVQIFTQSPRAWKPMQYGDEVLAAYREAQTGAKAATGVTETFCHATYLINVAATDPEVLRRSRDCLLANFAVATGMGAHGLVLHVGSHRGQGFDACVPQVVDALLETLASQPDGACSIVLENAAGTGDTVGRTFEELATLVEAVEAAERATGTRTAQRRLQVCLDTQHLWASGVDFSSMDKADRVVARFDDVVGLERLRCLHLNDSKVELGANRDRHENIGAGTIGAAALGALLSHPALVGLPAILEVPGGGQGARREDVAAARAAVALGIGLRQAS
ncbi:MAG TPA: deoxyribonuclease IV [Acidimicrobiales bacterium]|nr:deoxyribonuclease IV [Acidimicrobiales bacterium]